jgi:hypothetical protein
VYKLSALVLLLSACSSEAGELFPALPDAGSVTASSDEDGLTCDVHDETPSDFAVEKSNAPGTLHWWRYAGDPADLQAAMDCALNRWIAATGLGIDISYVPNHWVRHDTTANMNGKSGYAWTSDGWATSRIKLDVALDADHDCQVLVHELGHVLRKSGGHPGPDGSMCHPVTRVNSSPRSKILQADLDEVCAVRACSWQIPE